MENILKALYIGVGAFLLIVSITMLYSYQSEFNKLLTEQKKALKEDVLIEGRYQDEKDATKVSYEELIGEIMSELEYPIRISGKFIEPRAFEQGFDFNSIENREYKKIYVYNNGKIEQINYD